MRPAGFVMNILKERYEQQVEQRKLAGSAWEAWHTEAEHKKALVFTNEIGHHTSRRSRRKSAHRTREYTIYATPLLSFPCRTGMM